jgi:adenine-specific DNA-methyltransferase
MYDRLQSANLLLSDDAIGCVTIDDFEFHRLRSVMSQMYSEECIAGVVGIKNNPAGRSTAKGFSIAHEYGIFFKTTPDTPIGRLEHSEKQKARYKFTDSKGQFEWVNFRKHGGANAYRTARPKLFYPIIIDDNGFRIPKMHFEHGEYIIDEDIPKNVSILYPITPTGEEKTWKWGYATVLENLDEFSVRTDQTGEKEFI